MKAFYKQHPLFAYFSLAYLISWGGIFLIILYNGFNVFQDESILSKGISGNLMLIWLAMLAGPAIAGLFLKRMVDGKEGLRQLFSLMFRWKAGIGWYAAALLIIPALLVPVMYSFVLVSEDYTPGLMLGTGIAAGFIGGFFEEIGWTGFALPKLQLKHTPFIAALILGLIHALWHLLADYLGGITFYKALYSLHFLLWIIALTAFRLLNVWIYNHSKSLLLAQLTHGSFTGSQLIFGPPAVNATGSVLWYAVFTSALCVLVSIIVLKDKNLFFHKIHSPDFKQNADE